MAAPPQLPGLTISNEAPQERGDAARNRTLLLEAARRLITERGPDAVTTDDIAAAAGVGKGTLFRRFGSRAGLMIVLLDEDEKAEQQAFLFGPPPLGPGAPPAGATAGLRPGPAEFRQRTPRAAVGRQPRPADAVQRAGDAAPPHVTVLLEDAGTTGDLDAQADRPARAARRRLRAPPTRPSAVRR